MNAVLEASGLGKQYGGAVGRSPTARSRSRRARSSGSSVRTAPARRRSSTSPSACSNRPPARSRCSAAPRPMAPYSSAGSASSRRTRRPTRPVGRRPPPLRRLDQPDLGPALAERRIDQLGLDPRQKAGKLSGGQRAQLALTLAIAKRPELLILDEPVASLDPLARREFLQGLMEVVVEHGVSVILSSHLVADLERVCDYLVVLVASRVQVAGEIEELLATHHRLTAPRRDARATCGPGGHRGEPHR